MKTFSLVSFAFLLLLGFLVIPKSAYAATFTVNSTTDAVDANPGNGSCATAGSVCTLRAAIQEANALAGTDTITLPAGTYTLSIAGTGEDADATGDLDITSDMTINGASEATTIIDAATIDRVVDISNTATVTVSNLTVKNGNVTGKGGGFNTQFGSTLTVNHIIVSNNTSSSYGGGIETLGTMILTDVNVSNNTSGNSAGGGMDTNGFPTTITNSIFDSNSGGGIFADGTTMTNVIISNNHTNGASGGGINMNPGNTLTNVTVSGNTATGDVGGGIYMGGVNNTLTNVTVSGNSADQGGGIYFNDNSTLTNVTIANNTASSGNGAGIFISSGYTETLKNTLLFSNTIENCTVSGGTLTSLGNNLSSDSSCSSFFNQTGDLNSTNPLISSLADNGGSVQTMALQSGSPAIDAGTNTGCTSTDARGTSRPQDGDNNGTSTCDIGAYEYVYVAATTSTSVSALADKCPQVGNSWVGDQVTVPNGVGINDKGQCYDLPTAASSLNSPRLPNTGIGPDPLVSEVSGNNIPWYIPFISGIGIWALLVLIQRKHRFSYRLY